MVRHDGSSTGGRSVKSLLAVASQETGNDDVEGLVRAAARLTRDLNVARPLVFWSDLLVTVTVGYFALATAMTAHSGWLVMAGGLVAVLALYRAESFIHEITHLKPGSVAGFHTAWNLLVGVPMLTPSFLYEGVHNLHHAHGRYGTAEDPEYLRLSGVSEFRLAALVAAGALAPFALFVRFFMIAPLSIASGSLRRLVVERCSALAINPSFRRKKPVGRLRRTWNWFESAAAVWALGLVLGYLSGFITGRIIATYFLILCGVAVVNQVRTLASHVWESDGRPLSVTAQFIDTVNVPPPSPLAALWAPVGLRYHALHHLLPGIPYHALGEAHRRLMASATTTSMYRMSNRTGLIMVLRRLAGHASRRSQ